MWKLTAFFTVILAATILINDVESQTLQGIDLKSFLQSLRKQLLKVKESNDDLEVNKLEDDEVDEESNFGSLKDEQLEHFVALVPSSDNREKDRQSLFIANNDRGVRNSQLTKLLEQLLDQGRVNSKYQNKGTLDDDSRVQPSDLLVPSHLLDDSNKYNPQLVNNLELKDDDSADLGEYSKVYVILNPDSVRLSKNKNNLKELLSGLLSRPRSEKKDRRYKGFIVKDSNYRTARRNRDDDYMDPIDKPKRGRPARGGGKSWGKRGGGGGGGRGRGSDLRSSGHNRGGGGGGGHTAIPYINHNAGVYERDD